MASLRLRSGSLLIASLLLPAVLSGCNPELQGLCATNADCPSGTECLDGICVNPNAGVDAGKSPVCSPACTNGLVCDDGTCVSSSTAFVDIVSPTNGAEFGPMNLTVLLQVNAPDTITSVQVDLNTPTQTILQANATAGSATGSYSAVFDLTAVQITGGDYQLVATMMHGAGQLVTSTPVSILIDKSGPVITFQPVSYPASGHFLRDDTVVLTADISDALSGVSTTSPPSLTAPGITTPIIGQPVQGHIYSFTFSARLPTFPTWIGPVNVQVTATDVVGNQTQASSSFQLCRLRWIWTKPRTQGVTTAPAIVGDVVVVGGSESYLYGVRRADGSTSWDLPTSSAPVGHIAAGASNAYAAEVGGTVIAFNPADETLSQSARTVYTCSPTPPVALRDLVSGPAIGLTQISSSNTAQQETLFEFSGDGYLQLFRQTNFPAPTGQTPGCAIETQVTTSSNVAAVPALLPQGNDITAFMGDVGKAVHKYTVSLGTGANATFDFSSDWSFQMSDASEDGPAALGLPAGVTGLLFGNNSGQLFAIDLNANELWSMPDPSMMPGPAGPLNQNVALQASPVMDGSSAYMLDQSGAMQKVSLSSGDYEWANPVKTQARNSAANAAPIVADDGTVYIPAGSAIAAYSSDATLAWSFDTATTALSGLLVDASSPIMSCGGDIYLVGTSSAQGYLFDLISDSVTGPATSGWPRSFHDNHNTANSGTPLLNASGACTD